MVAQNRMLPLARLSARDAARFRFILSDIDDTLTHRGRLLAETYRQMEALQTKGRKVILVTGRPAGWCDLIARFWPVDAVVGENGAFYFRYDHRKRKMLRKFRRPQKQRDADTARLRSMFARLRREFRGIELAADQPFRISDIAIDVCEDRLPLPDRTVRRLMARLEEMGATVKLSSIHINAWIGDFNKLQMIRELLRDAYGLSGTAMQKSCVYLGDSPNDEPMFSYFRNSIGVANIRTFAPRMTALPRYVTRRSGGHGFAEFAALVLRR
ncbi:MAG TPA: HAD-IIB family hydrolase [Rhizomicrobium sp.]|nr:HAD-IIB family hydrolase [Rhizomicrobium sp.]